MKTGIKATGRNAVRAVLAKAKAPVEGAEYLSSATARAAAGSAAGRLRISVKAGSKAISVRSIAAADALHATAQGVLASDLAQISNALMQGIASGPATFYDRAMDARFIETGIGGSYHRLFDGNHTVAGAFEAARGASPDDTLVQESLGAVLGLLRDVSTPRGLPLATWNHDTFNQVAGALESNFLIPKSWFADLNAYTGAELLGGAIGAVAVVFSWNRAEVESFSRLAGSLGLAALMGANPLLGLVWLVSLAKAFHKSRRSGDYTEFIDGQVRGGMVSGASIAAVSVVGLAGGPVGLALLVAIVAGMFASQASKRVSVIQVARVVLELAAKAAAAQGPRRGLSGIGRILVEGSGILIRRLRSMLGIRVERRNPAG